MGGRKSLVLACAVPLLIAAGCGGNGSSETSEATPARKAESSVEKPPATPKKPQTHLAKRDPASEFLGPNGENTEAALGEEASDAERRQASRLIAAWLKARAAEDWAADCSYLSRRYRHHLVAEDAASVSHGEVENCPQALDYFGIAASGDGKDTLSGSIDSLRAAGTLGFALYHGNDGKDWAVPMYKEGGKWLVATTLPSELEG
jgi:hypothetical protein